MQEKTETLAILLTPAVMAFAVSAPCLAGPDKSIWLIRMGTIGAPIAGLLWIPAVIVKKKIKANANTIGFMVMTIIIGGGGWWWIDDFWRSERIFLTMPATMTFMVGIWVGLSDNIRKGVMKATAFAVLYTISCGGLVFTSSEIDLKPTFQNILILIIISVGTSGWSIWHSYELKKRAMEEHGKS